MQSDDDVPVHVQPTLRQSVSLLRRLQVGCQYADPEHCPTELSHVQPVMDPHWDTVWRELHGTGLPVPEQSEDNEP